MVLGREDNPLHASLFADTSPLPTVEVRGIEQLRILIAEAPLLIGIRVQRIMDKRIHLHILPTQLIGIRQRPTRIYRRILCHCAHPAPQHHHHYHYSFHHRLNFATKLGIIQHISKFIPEMLACFGGYSYLCTTIMEKKQRTGAYNKKGQI